MKHLRPGTLVRITNDTDHHYRTVGVFEQHDDAPEWAPQLWGMRMEDRYFLEWYAADEFEPIPTRNSPGFWETAKHARGFSGGQGWVDEVIRARQDAKDYNSGK